MSTLMMTTTPCLMSKPTKKATCMAVHQAVVWTAQVILCMVVRVGGGEVALKVELDQVHNSHPKL